MHLSYFFIDLFQILFKKEYDLKKSLIFLRPYSWIKKNIWQNEYSSLKLPIVLAGKQKTNLYRIVLFLQILYAIGTLYV